MTRQEIFDKVISGLAAQGWKQSTYKNPLTGVPSCRYRGDGGTKCAIGHLIPDDLYRPDLENMVVYSKDVKEVLEKANIFPDNDGYFWAFLADLQDAHDSLDSSTPEGMKLAMARFARVQKLVFNGA